VKDIFISYAKKDWNTANELCELLEDHGFCCWIAPRDILPGKEFDEAILDGIDESRIMIVVLSPNANSSRFVKAELNRAFAQGKSIITLRERDIEPAKALGLYLARHQWSDGFPPPLKQHIERLITAIRLLLYPSAVSGNENVSIQTPQNRLTEGDESPSFATSGTSIPATPIFLGGPERPLVNAEAEEHLMRIVGEVSARARASCRTEGLIDNWGKLELGTLLYRGPSDALRACISEQTFVGDEYSIQVSLLSGVKVIVHPEIECGTLLETIWTGTPLEKLLNPNSLLAGGARHMSPPKSFFYWVDTVSSRLFESRGIRYNIGLLSECMNAFWSITLHGTVYVFAEAHLK